MSVNGDSIRNSEYCNSKENGNYVELGLGRVLFDAMKKYNNSILQYIADTNETDTYGQVLTRSIRTALKLKENGITRGDIISTCTYKHKNTCIPFVASLFLGVKISNFHPSLSHSDTIHLLKLVRPKIIFVSTESVPLMERCLKESNVQSELVVFGSSKKYSQFSEYLVPNSEEENFRPVVIEDCKETAVILFSSGTTGLPKAVCLSHYSFLKNVYSNDYFQLTHGKEKSVSLIYSTYYWISAPLTLIRCVVVGSSMVVCSSFDVTKVWRIIEKYKVTLIFLSTYLANDLFSTNPPKDVDTSSLKLFLVGGSTVPIKLVEGLRDALPHVKICQGYGQTETVAAVSFFDVDNPEHMDMQIRKPLSCGRVRPGIMWKVVDPTTEKILGPYQRGEIRVKSDYFMNGYYKMDSSSVFDSEGYIKTGDMVYYDEEECLYVVDRIKEMFKYKGWFIRPAVLEEVVMSHPAVKEAAVIGIPHDGEGEYPMAIVVLNAGDEHVTPEDIEMFVEERVPDVQRLRAGVKIVKKIIKTVTGKHRRSAMRQLVLNGEI